MSFFRFIKNMFITKKSLNTQTVNKNNDDFIELQFKIINKGADIMRAQGALLNMIEQPLFSKLAQPENWNSTIITPSWITRVKQINNMISEYQEMVYKLDYFYNEKQN
jgi:hypothetical protein